MIASLVADAAPGEIDAVKHDIEVFTGNNSGIKSQLAEEVQRLNVEQLRVVEVDGKLTVLSKYNQINPTTFYTHGSKPIKFEVDHVTRKTSSLGAFELEDGDKEELAQLQRQADSYAKQHYAGEFASAVFATKNDSEYALILVGRRLSPQNFHNGQITAEYHLNSGTGKLKGKIFADVHFFEDGNVRLKSTHPVNSEFSDSKLGESLKKVENDFESNLNKTLVGLNEREFKSLRRQLPVTRQPMVWGKAVAGYKLGKELENR